MLGTVRGARRAGAHVLLMRYHDHTRVFRLPGPLRRALQRRIVALNAALDEAVAATPGVGVLDLDLLPGGYEPASWSVDRLHPSPRGHLLIAHAYAAVLSDISGTQIVLADPEAGNVGANKLAQARWIVRQVTPGQIARYVVRSRLG